MQTEVKRIRPEPADAPTRWVVETETTYQDGNTAQGSYSIGADELEIATDETIGDLAIIRAETGLSPLAAMHGEPS